LTATEEQGPEPDAAEGDKPGLDDEVGVVDRSPGASAVKLVAKPNRSKKIAPVAKADLPAKTVP
jgi:hypothetical protein